MSKKAKIITIIVSSILAVALITTAVLLGVFNEKRENTKSTIMTCSVNPEVQFVLNGNDKVVEVIALNNDAQEIVINGKFEGLKADDAAELFISLSTQAGYIKLDTAGTKVEINITGLKDDYEKLKNKVVKSVNKYFDENGIIAGAIGKIDNSIKEAILTIKNSEQTVNNIKDKTEEQLMEHYLKLTELIKTNKIDGGKLETYLNHYDTADKKLQMDLDDIKAANEQDEVILNKLLDIALDQLTEEDRSKINNIRNRINFRNTHEQTAAYNDFYDKINDKLHIGAYILDEKDIEAFKESFSQKASEFKDKYNEHKVAFENDKTNIENKINEFRKTLNA